MIEIKDLKKGQTISLLCDNTKWIINFNGIKDEYIVQNGSISDSNYYKDINMVWGNLNLIQNLRLATKQEKQWLNLCIKHNKFMPKPEFKQEIYELW